MDERASAASDLEGYRCELESEDDAARSSQQLRLHVEGERRARRDEIIHLQTKRAKRIASIAQRGLAVREISAGAGAQ